MVGRVCLDRLKASSTRHETFGDDEIIDVEEVSAEADPAHSALIADSVGAALMVVLDSMSPEERVAFVLHDVFAVPFEPIAQILDRTPQATRKLASRARARVQGDPEVPKVDVAKQRSFVEAFLQAARAGDFDGLVRMLHPDVVMRPDEAAIAMGSMPETRGAESIARILSGGARGTRLVVANGLTALAWGSRAHIKSVIEFTIMDDQIIAISVTADENRIAEMGVEDLG